MVIEFLLSLIAEITIEGYAARHLPLCGVTSLRLNMYRYHCINFDAEQMQRAARTEEAAVVNKRPPIRHRNKVHNCSLTEVAESWPAGPKLGTMVRFWRTDNANVYVGEMIGL
jgi:hypothetical protein